MLGEENSEKIAAWLKDHPRVLRAATIGLVAFGIFNLVNAIRLDQKAAALIAGWKGDMQRAVSEGLGG